MKSLDNPSSITPPGNVTGSPWASGYAAGCNETAFFTLEVVVFEPWGLAALSAQAMFCELELVPATEYEGAVHACVPRVGMKFPMRVFEGVMGRSRWAALKPLAREFEGSPDELAQALHSARSGEGFFGLHAGAIERYERLKAVANADRKK